ncbi:MAG: cyclic nucleotide-binding domain-containing protein [Sphingomonadaceae bacterium]|nr:cyclic nucleotide-binding domain-containing protein [Sphingomonadaceae bacterium]
MPGTPILGQTLLVLAWGYAVWNLTLGRRARWPEAIAALAAASLIAAGPFHVVALIEVAALVVALFLIVSRGRQGGAALAGDVAPIAAALPGLSAASVSHLVAQGVWVAGKPGEVLIDEWKPIANLYFLASGSATVSVAGRSIGMCRPGQFAGEATVMSGDPATATVTLAESARLWCIEAEKLRETARLHEDVRAAVEAAIRQSLTEKLVATNRAAAKP